MSDLDELKHLLLGKEKEVIDDLGQQLRDPCARAEFVGAVLPEALRSASKYQERLERALRDTVTLCIMRAVRRDAQAYADALYPAMGPAIRKSISETLKQFVQSLNQALEHSLSAKGLRWRWEAWRSGAPFAEVVLKNTLVYRVEEAYLIHRVSGLLVEHVARAEAPGGKDEDAVSAMLTAIQDFVRDAFSGGSDVDLDTVDIGERTLWVVRGPDAMLACLIRGIPPVTLRGRLRELVDEIHLIHARALREFSGDRSSLAGLSDLMERGLESEQQQQADSERFPWAALALGVLLLFAAGAGLLYVSDAPQHPTRQAFLQALAAEPGFVTLEAREQAGLYVVRGLRDPLASDPRRLAAAAGLGTESIRLDFKPYQSLDPTLTLKRVRRVLQPPVGVTLELEQGVLRVSGRTAPDWVDRVRAAFIPPVGIESVDLSALRDDPTIMLQQLRRKLAPPNSVDLALNGRSLTLSGSAPFDWLEQLDRALLEVVWLDGCSSSDLIVQEWARVHGLLQSIAETELRFVEGLTLTQLSSKRLKHTQAILVEALNLTAVLAVPLRVSVTGYSDGTGNQGRNFWLRHQRAEYVKQRLEQSGLGADQVSTKVEPRFEASPQPDLTQRRVVIEVAPASVPTRPSVLCK